MPGRVTTPIGALGLVASDMGKGRLNSSRFGPISTFKLVTPVTLPPGRLRLATQPSCTGSRLVVNTMGIVVVAALAGNSATPFGAITSTLRRTKSAASAGKRLYCPSAQQVLYGYVAALDVTGFAYSLAKCGQRTRIPRGRCY